MAKITVALATPHSPQVSTTAEQWFLHRERDIANPSLGYARRAAAAPPWIEAELTLERFREKDRMCQAAIASLAQALADDAPDVVIVVGDDQHELFHDDCIPAIAIFTGGKEVIDTAPPIDTLEHPSFAVANWAYHATRPETYPIDAELAQHLATALTGDGFDIGVLQQHRRELVMSRI